SALGHLSRDSFPYEDLHEPVRELLESYGPERLLWGSDWPHVHEFGTYEESAQSVAAAIGFGRAAEQELVFGGTARSLYGFRS
ncbi:MAG: amidohydrolase family protein, partial [Geodermatophilaceae bacterium]